jgi:hypoxanthine phosphoribosyltransferase
MKFYLSYEQMTGLIKPFLPLLQEEGFDEVVAVIRGGMTAAHFIAKELRLPVGCYFPSNPVDKLPPRIVLNRNPKKILIVEDLVAQGRTFRELESFMGTMPWIDWQFMPILVDGDSQMEFKYQCLKTKDWIVFPYEDCDKMTEGDRGLFRDGSDVYGK